MKKIKICFIGIDGTGKSTLIDYIKKRFKIEKKSVKIIFMGWRDFSNPILRLFSKLYMKKSKKVKENRIDRYRERSWIFYFIYYSELMIRYVKSLFYNVDFILFDRYFYDELVFSRGLKYKFFKLITPRPDLCLILRVSPKVLRNRGYTFSFIKLNNYYTNFYKIRDFCKMIEINSDKSLEKLYLEVVRFVG